MCIRDSLYTLNGNKHFLKLKCQDIDNDHIDYDKLLTYKSGKLVSAVNLMSVSYTHLDVYKRQYCKFHLYVPPDFLWMLTLGRQQIFPIYIITYSKTKRNLSVRRYESSLLFTPFTVT